MADPQTVSGQATDRMEPNMWRMGLCVWRQPLGSRMIATSPPFERDRGTNACRPSQGRRLGPIHIPTYVLDHQVRETFRLPIIR